MYSQHSSNIIKLKNPEKNCYLVHTLQRQRKFCFYWVFLKSLLQGTEVKTLQFDPRASRLDARVWLPDISGSIWEYMN